MLNSQKASQWTSTLFWQAAFPPARTGYEINSFAYSPDTIQFAIDDWWISDDNSYIFQQLASMFVMALEDSLVLQISYEAEQELKQRKHVYETLFRILAETTAAHMARRVIVNLPGTVISS